jgi:hypothetical protein
VHSFFRDNLNSGAYIVSSELNQDPELFKSFYRMSIGIFSLLVDFVGPKTRRYKFSYSYACRGKTTDHSQVRKVYLLIAIHIQQISTQIQ